MRIVSHFATFLFLLVFAASPLAAGGLQMSYLEEPSVLFLITVAISVALMAVAGMAFKKKRYWGAFTVSIIVSFAAGLTIGNAFAAGAAVATSAAILAFGTSIVLVGATLCAASPISGKTSGNVFFCGTSVVFYMTTGLSTLSYYYVSPVF